MGWRDIFGVILILGAATFAGEARAERQLVWYQHGLASATGGYDGAADRTLIHRWYLVAYGPTQVEGAAMPVLRACVKSATITAVGAFREAPLSDASVPVAAAWAAFQTGIQGCLNRDHRAKVYADRFEVGYVRRAFWSDGLDGKFWVGSESTQSYRQLHNQIKDRLPEPLNRLVVFHLEDQPPADLEVRFRLPEEGSQFLGLLPDGPKLRDLQQQLEAQGREIAGELKQEAEQRQATQALGNPAAKLADQPQAVARLALSLSNDAVMEANRIILAQRAKGTRLLVPSVAGFLGTRTRSDGGAPLDLKGAVLQPVDPEGLTPLPDIDGSGTQLPLVPSMPEGPKIVLKQAL